MLPERSADVSAASSVRAGGKLTLTNRSKLMDHLADPKGCGALPPDRRPGGAARTRRAREPGPIRIVARVVILCSGRSPTREVER